MKKRLLAFLLAIGTLAGVSCTGDLNDVDTCYAIAQTYCKKANACDPTYLPSVDGGRNCVSELYEACTGAAPLRDAGTNPFSSSNSSSIPNTRSCLDAIDGTACGMSAGNACNNIPGLPDAAAPPAPVDSGAPEGGPADSGMGIDSGMIDSTVVQDTAPNGDTGVGMDSGLPVVCAPAMPCLLGNDGPGITQLAVSSSQVFWVSGGTTIRTLQGGSPATFSQRSSSIQNLIAAPGGAVAWIENQQALSQATAGSLPIPQLSGASVSAIAVESSGGPGWIYGLTVTGTQVIDSQLSTGGATGTVNLVGGSFSAIGGDAAGTFVAWANSNTGTIQGASSGSLLPKTFGSAPSPISIAVAGTANTVLALESGGNAVAALNGSTFPIGQGSTSAIAASGSTGAELSQAGQITITSVSGGTPTNGTFAVTGTPTTIAVGGTSVYWATSTGDIYSYTP